MNRRYTGTINRRMLSITGGSISPCTSRIQLSEKPFPGNARKVTELMMVAISEIPIAHAGSWESPR